MRDELKFAGVKIVIESVIVVLHRVSIPVPGEHIQCNMSEKHVHIQMLLNFLQTFGQILFVKCVLQRLLGVMIERISAGVDTQLGEDVLQKPAVVKVAIDVVEVTAQPFFVETLHHHVEPQIASIEFHGGVSGTWGGDASTIEQFTADDFVAEGVVLPGIVQVEFVVSPEILIINVCIQIHRESRFGVDGLETPRCSL